MPEVNLYGTQSLYEAAYLLSLGFRLNGKSTERSKVVIFFEGHDVHNKALEFYNGGKVVAKSFADAYRTIKDYVFER